MGRVSLTINADTAQAVTNITNLGQEIDKAVKKFDSKAVTTWEQAVKSSVNNIAKEIENISKSVANVNEAIAKVQKFGIEESVKTATQSVQGLTNSVKTEMEKASEYINQFSTGLAQKIQTGVTNAGKEFSALPGAVQKQLDSAELHVGNFSRRSNEKIESSVNKSITSISKLPTSAKTELDKAKLSVDEFGAKLETKIKESVANAKASIAELNTSLTTSLNTSNKGQLTTSVETSINEAKTSIAGLNQTIQSEMAQSKSHVDNFALNLKTQIGTAVEEAKQKVRELKQTISENIGGKSKFDSITKVFQTDIPNAVQTTIQAIGRIQTETRSVFTRARQDAIDFTQYLRNGLNGEIREMTQHFANLKKSTASIAKDMESSSKSATEPMKELQTAVDNVSSGLSSIREKLNNPSPGRFTKSLYSQLETVLQPISKIVSGISKLRKELNTGFSTNGADSLAGSTKISTETMNQLRNVAMRVLAGVRKEFRELKTDVMSADNSIKSLVTSLSGAVTEAKKGGGLSGEMKETAEQTEKTGKHLSFSEQLFSRMRSNMYSYLTMWFGVGGAIMVATKALEIHNTRLEEGGKYSAGKFNALGELRQKAGGNYDAYYKMANEVYESGYFESNEGAYQFASGLAMSGIAPEEGYKLAKMIGTKLIPDKDKLSLMQFISYAKANGVTIPAETIAAMMFRANAKNPSDIGPTARALQKNFSALQNAGFEVPDMFAITGLGGALDKDLVIATAIRAMLGTMYKKGAMKRAYADLNGLQWRYDESKQEYYITDEEGNYEEKINKELDEKIERNEEILSPIQLSVVLDKWRQTGELKRMFRNERDRRGGLLFTKFAKDNPGVGIEEYNKLLSKLKEIYKSGKDPEMESAVNKQEFSPSGANEILKRRVTASTGKKNQYLNSFGDSATQIRELYSQTNSYWSISGPFRGIGDTWNSFNLGVSKNMNLERQLSKAAELLMDERVSDKDKETIKLAIQSMVANYVLDELTRKGNKQILDPNRNYVSDVLAGFQGSGFARERKILNPIVKEAVENVAGEELERITEGGVEGYVQNEKNTKPYSYYYQLQSPDRHFLKKKTFYFVRGEGWTTLKPNLEPKSDIESIAKTAPSPATVNGRNWQEEADAKAKQEKEDAKAKAKADKEAQAEAKLAQKKAEQEEKERVKKQEEYANRFINASTPYKQKFGNWFIQNETKRVLREDNTSRMDSFTWNALGNKADKSFGNVIGKALFAYASDVTDEKTDTQIAKQLITTLRHQGYGYNDIEKNIGNVVNQYALEGGDITDKAIKRFLDEIVKLLTGIRTGTDTLAVPILNKPKNKAGNKK